MVLKKTRNIFLQIPQKYRLYLTKIVPTGVLRQFRKYYLEAWADVCLISFPKCGRTWLSLMIGRTLQQTFALPYDQMLNLDKLAMYNSNIPAISVTHDDNPHHKMPHQLEQSKRKYRHKKVVFLARDPRDVIVSLYFHHTKRSKSYKGDLSSFLREPVGSMATLLQFYSIWAENSHVPKDFTLVRYKDLHRNPVHELKRVIKFLDLDQIQNSVITEAAKFSSFNNMRKLEKNKELRDLRLMPIDPQDVNSYKTREGKVGSFRKYLSESDIEYINGLMTQLPPMYGYNLETKK